MCEHKRKLIEYAKGNDLQKYTNPHLEIDHDGYASFIDNLRGGDYVQFEICLDCGTVIGFKLMTDEELLEYFYGL